MSPIFEVRILCKSGRYITGEFIGAPHIKDGKVIEVIGFAREITDRKKAEEVLKEKTEELARSNRELEAFAYVASHDLQEPLRMVTNFVQLLAKRYKGKLDSNADDFINFAVDGAMRMWNLINDLLAYSRVGTRGHPFEPINCETILQEALDNLKVAMEESGAVVTHDSLPTVTADSSQLGQLFQNLIGNAIKFRGNERPRIHVSANRNGNGWTFSVRDNGIGIAPEYTERIFIIFQRLHGRQQYPGTGIGLAICKKIVERHGGRIWVESTPEKGATFYFTLPKEGVQQTRPLEQ
jgi:light-regulated signal transduction histidine kinase (bacteriophytochrome)